MQSVNGLKKEVKVNNSQLNIVPFVPFVPCTSSTSSTNQHRYILEKGSRKHYCPDCNKKTFVRYIDIETSNYLPEQYGRCDRESKCYNHLNPYLDGYVKAIWQQENGNRSEFKSNWKPKRKITEYQPKQQTTFFDFETFKQTLNPERYDRNVFIQNLLINVQFPFETYEITNIIELYRLGTVANGYRSGSTCFPFIDVKGNVRAIQVKQFDEHNHTIGTDFLHSIIEKYYTQINKPLPEWLEQYKEQDKKISCLFGEHLLNKYPNNPIALVEAPKTAIYGTLYFGLPNDSNDLIWLAVYNKSSFSFDKLKVLQGRYVYVFPDLSKDGNTFNEWKSKAKDYENKLIGTRFIFSDLLEKLAPEQDKNEGNDIADYLIKQDWRKYRKRNIKEPPQKNESLKIDLPIIKVDPQPEPLPKVEVKRKNIVRYTLENNNSWNDKIRELEAFFENIELPTQPIKVNAYSTIIDSSLYVESHFAIVKANQGKRTFLPYLHRLQEFKNTLSENII